MRIAIYARYSSDLQNPVSIEDQLSLCTDLMKRQFGIDKPVATYTDAAISGATMSRPGLINLLDAAEARSFDVLIAEGLDRISRSLSDIATIHELLVHYGIKIWTGHEGEVSDLHVGFKGTMNALYLRDLKEKVKRAHRSIAASGRAASSIAYGYSVVRGVLDEKGNYVNGLRKINPDQAAVIKRIFKEYAAGIPLRQIVRSLNDDGIPSPSGKLWRPNSITGEDHRYKGILHNDLYRGLLVYNRTHKIVDPRSGKRRYVVNPASEWIPSPNSVLFQIDSGRKHINADLRAEDCVATHRANLSPPPLKIGLPLTRGLLQGLLSAAGAAATKALRTTLDMFAQLTALNANAGMLAAKGKKILRTAFSRPFETR